LAILLKRVADSISALSRIRKRHYCFLKQSVKLLGIKLPSVLQK
jgi:hypothetical protein